MKKYIFFIIGILSWSFSVSAEVIVKDPWARASSGLNAAFFMTLYNNGNVDDALIKVETDTTVCTRTELHTHKHCHGVMKMREIPEVKISANNHTKLAPGGLHVMLMKLVQPLKAADTFNVVLYFKNQKPLRITVPVKAQ